LAPNAFEICWTLISGGISSPGELIGSGYLAI